MTKAGLGGPALVVCGIDDRGAVSVGGYSPPAVTSTVPLV
jgi:hypothetical protein